MEQVIFEYYMACQSYIAPQIEAQKSPKEMLRVYIESNLTFVDENRQHVFAVIEIVSNERTVDGKLRFAADHDDTIFLPIENILTLGMEVGIFREFTTLTARVMVLTMRNPQLDVQK